MSTSKNRRSQKFSLSTCTCRPPWLFLVITACFTPASVARFSLRSRTLTPPTPLSLVCFLHPCNLSPPRSFSVTSSNIYPTALKPLFFRQSRNSRTSLSYPQHVQRQAFHCILSYVNVTPFTVTNPSEQNVNLPLLSFSCGQGRKPDDAPMADG